MATDMPDAPSVDACLGDFRTKQPLLGFSRDTILMESIADGTPGGRTSIFQVLRDTEADKQVRQHRRILPLHLVQDVCAAGNCTSKPRRSRISFFDDVQDDRMHGTFPWAGLLGTARLEREALAAIVEQHAASPDQGLPSDTQARDVGNMQLGVTAYG